MADGGCVESKSRAYRVKRRGEKALAPLRGLRLLRNLLGTGGGVCRFAEALAPVYLISGLRPER